MLCYKYQSVIFLGSLLELAKMDERKVRTDLLFIHKYVIEILIDEMGM